MLLKIIIVVAVIVMIGSLFSSLYYMFKDKGSGTRTVKALSVRISIWVILFVLLVIGLYTGILKPSNSLIQHSQEPSQNAPTNK